jgi:hypothetical protein
MSVSTKSAEVVVSNIAHFGSGLGKHPVLHKVRRAYALTDEGQRLTGSAPALRPFQASTHRA